jgi:UDP-N-acetylglucosamine acyltransferase
MPSAQSPRIHPTAVISAEAHLADDVQIGPFVVIEGPVRISAGCVLRPHVQLCGPLTLGRENVVFAGAVLGERPQHLKYNGEPTQLEIGDHNTFRENVTIHRGTTHSWTTRIGNHNFFMAGSHVAHDCQVGNHCIFANGALIGGHCQLQDGVYLSGNCAIHQFVRVGRLALLSGASITTKDIPPFIMQQGRNSVCGVNVVGMRRSGMSQEQINAVRSAFHIIYRSGLLLPAALAQTEHEWGHIDAVAEMLAFIRQSPHGINPIREQQRDAA